MNQVKEGIYMKTFAGFLLCLLLAAGALPGVRGAAMVKAAEAVDLSGGNLDDGALAGLVESGEIPADVTALDLSNNFIADIAPLARLQNLQALNLYGNYIYDLGPLKGLAGLKILDLGYNLIQDLTPLQSLTQLAELNISQNLAADLTPLGGLGNLNRLYARDNPLETFPAAFPKLVGLDLSAAGLGELSFVANLTALKDLYVSENEITDLSPLAALGDLRVLDISFNQVRDLSPLGGLKNLDHLYARENPLENLPAVSGLTTLTALDLSAAGLGDLAFAAPLTAIKKLYVSENNLADLAPLQGLGSLQMLDLSFNHIRDLTPLGALGELWLLDLGGNAVEDLAPLQTLTALESLYLSENAVKDPLPLGGLSALTTLDLIGNPVAGAQVEALAARLPACDIHWDAGEVEGQEAPAAVPTPTPTPTTPPTPTASVTPSPTPAPTATPSPTATPVPKPMASPTPVPAEDLIRDKKITLAVTGRSIQSTALSITNHTINPVSVLLEYGTWFESGASSVQNMLLTKRQTLTVSPRETKTFTVPTACMNASREIPGESNKFTLRSGALQKLTNLARYAEEHELSYYVIQSAVWIITDNLSDEVLRGILISNGVPVITQAHVDEARTIVAGLR
jgi:Leucine-rich repeat (LRR) protein